MTSLSLYLASPKTKQILSKKPGDEGFSLIELVVVVAVLAILVAVALPNFTLITHKARVNQGKNALVTAIKECNVTAADTGTATYTAFTVESFTVSGDCANGFAITAATSGQYPTFNVSATGGKTCTRGATAVTGSLGCTTGTPGTWAQ